jgi:hypothetical protein
MLLAGRRYPPCCWFVPSLLPCCASLFAPSLLCVWSTPAAYPAERIAEAAS